MEYRKIGNTGLCSSVIGLGTEYLYHAPLSVVERTVHQAIDQGVNLLDMVVPSEAMRSKVGKAIAGKREKLLIQGHLCSTDINEQFDVSRDLPTVKRYFEMMLRTLDTDYIDFGMLFLIDTEESYRDVFDSNIIEYALDLKKKGIVRHLGASSHHPDISLHMVKTGLIDLLMFPVNPALDLMDAQKSPARYPDVNKAFHSNTDIKKNQRIELYRYCERNGIAISAMKPFLGGRLLDKNLSPFEQSMTVGQCLHYSLTRPGVVSAICGCADEEEVKSACEYSNLSPVEIDFVPPMAEMKRDFGGKCVYCNHCEPCPSGIHIAEVNRVLDLALIDREDVPTELKSKYFLLESSGSDCIQCGQCEERCPFSVPIIKNMNLARDVFGE